MLFQLWYLVENESWDVHLNFDTWLKMKRTSIDVVSMFNNNVQMTLIELRRFNIDEPMLFRCWTLVEIKVDSAYVYRRRFSVTKQSWSKIERITLIQRRWSNVVVTLIVSWKWNLSQRMFIRRYFDIEKTALKQLCRLLY